MDKLLDAMKKVLADSYAFYIKAHYYHWNVEGPDFYEFHSLFEQIYSEVYGSVDTIAEHIRALKGYAPGSFGRFSELTSIEDDNTLPIGMEMANRLLADTQKLILTLTLAYHSAEAVGEIGVSNFLQDRVVALQKHAWMLRATTARK